MRITSAFGIRLSGTMDKSFTIFSRNGKLFMRPYAAPKDPKSEQQTKHREIFKTATAAWKGLSGRQREFYNRIAHEMTGYNLFISRCVKALRSGEEPEVPIPIKWTVLRPAVPDDGWLTIRNWRAQIFKDDLRNRNGEIRSLHQTERTQSCSAATGRGMSNWKSISSSTCPCQSSWRTRS